LAASFRLISVLGLHPATISRPMKNQTIKPSPCRNRPACGNQFALLVGTRYQGTTSIRYQVPGTRYTTTVPVVQPQCSSDDDWFPQVRWNAFTNTTAVSLLDLDSSLTTSTMTVLNTVGKPSAHYLIGINTDTAFHGTSEGSGRSDGIYTHFWVRIKSVSQSDQSTEPQMEIRQLMLLNEIGKTVLRLTHFQHSIDRDSHYWDAFWKLVTCTNFFLLIFCLATCNANYSNYNIIITTNNNEKQHQLLHSSQQKQCARTDPIAAATATQWLNQHPRIVQRLWLWRGLNRCSTIPTTVTTAWSER